MKIEQLIDRLGTLRKQISDLKDYEETIAKELRENLEKGVEYFGDEYVAVKTERIETVIDTVKVYDKVGLQKFLTIAKVLMKNARTVLSDTEIDQCVSEYKPQTAIEVRRRRK